mmetsp:Transcript_8324/g.23960  ORF Transcript_8324/g.23960 Transcript_8324/m.23960 type:complete len:584 (-) Transcript_8324:216-1967(-)
MTRKYTRADPGSSSSCFNMFLGRDGGKAVQDIYLGKHGRDSSILSTPNLAPAAMQPDIENDDLIVKEMNALSLQERQRVYEDINGVSECFKETPELVDEKLTLMESEIKKVKQRSAYEKAKFLNPRYVQDRDLRLMFLRCDEFDERKAAHRLVCFFEYKLYLFGADVLARDVTQADLGEKESSLLHREYFQVLPELDGAGRMVLVEFTEKLVCESFVHLVRVNFYCIMQLLKNVTLQKQGVVVISFECYGNKFSMSMPFTVDVAIMATKSCCAIPIKVPAFHFCYNDPGIAPMMSLVKLSIGKAGRMRFRAHFGSETECMYKLKTFGIPVEAFPLQGDRSRIDSTYYIKYINDRCEMERNEDFNNRRDQGDNAKGIEFPTEHCVLLGRGRTFQTHPGNLKLAALIESCMNWHKIAGRYGEKATISKEILQTIRQNGGRFLKRDAAKQMWVEVAESVAFEKVMYGFRTKTKRSRALHQHAAATGASSSLLPSSTTKTKKKQKMDHHNTTYQQAPSISAQLLFLSQNTATPSYPTAVVPPNGFPHPSNEMVTAEALRGGPLVFNMPHGDDGTKVVGGTGGGFVMQ